MVSGTVALPPPAGVPACRAALDRVRRYLYEELRPQRGPRGAGLARARALFGALGDPQDRFRAVHVAGTAGKGSVSAVVASLLRAHGFRGRAVAARQRDAEVETVLSAEATRRGCDPRWVDLGPPAVRAWTGPGGTELQLRGQPSLSPELTGRHQAGNAHLALRAVGAMAARDGWSLDADAAWSGMRSATLPGRFERRVVGGRTAVLDGAHDPMELAALVATVHEVYPGARCPWVLAFEQDEDLRAALGIIAPTVSLVVGTQFVTGDGDHPAGTSVPAEQIAMAAGECGVEAVVEEDPACAVARAAERARTGLPVVVSGSFHLLAAVGPGTTTR